MTPEDVIEVVRGALDMAILLSALPLMAALITGMAGDYDAIVAAATTDGKNIMPRVAALLDVMQISEITAVKSADTFERPIYAGYAIQTVQSSDSVKVITVRTACRTRNACAWRVTATATARRLCL